MKVEIGDIILDEYYDEPEYLYVIRTDFDKLYQSGIRERGMARRYLCINLSRGTHDKTRELYRQKYYDVIIKLYGEGPAEIPYALARLPKDRCKQVEEIPLNILSELLRARVVSPYLFDQSSPPI